MISQILNSIKPNGMLKMKSLFRIMLFTFLIGYIISCEKDNDEFMKPQVSEESKSSVRTLNDINSRWNIKEGEQLHFTKEETKSTQIINETSELHPNYRRLLRKVEKAGDDLEDCLIEHEDEDDPCEFEQETLEEAEEALEAYENAGLPQQCNNTGIAPTIHCGITTTQIIPRPGTRLLDYREFFSAVDYCENNLDLSQSPPSGFPLIRKGLHSITITATDRFGVSSSCILNVNVL